MHVVETVAPNSSLIPLCWKLWDDTLNYETLSRYTLCCREAMKNASSKNVFIYAKGKGWTRDGWLSNSHWNPQSDFMFHGLKDNYRKEFTEKETNNLKSSSMYSWINTLRSPLDLEKCRNKVMRWDHRPELIISAKRLQDHLQKRRLAVDAEYRKKLSFVRD
ncbi:hypothetical protein Q1695_007084 [Nippostrongylus brasiliensis]|nr:hypothetical protein Q1695_007084 [Nippostrongylus brasiliensis]